MSEEPKKYLVTLKTGDTGIFTNDNKYKDYPSRIVSGIYSILPRSGGESIPITSETVQSIQEIEDK